MVVMSLCHTLHVVRPLGVKEGKGLKLLGFELVSDIDIVVPEYPEITKYINEIRHEKITYRQVKAGCRFTLSTTELIILLSKEEYSGYCEAKGDTKGLQLSIRDVKRGNEFLLYPIFRYKRGLGSVIEDTHSINSGRLLQLQYKK